jgi:uncharacterized membrane protein
MSEARGVPGQGWYVAAGGAALGGVAVAVALVAWMILGRDDGTQFVAPGRIQLELRPGPYLIWSDYRTTFEGVFYESPQPMPAGTVVRVRDATGAAVATRRSAGHEFKSAKADRSALLAFEIAQPGRYEITVEGAFPRRVLSVAPDRVFRGVFAVFGAIAAVLLGFAAGFGLWAWAYFNRDAAAERTARAGAATLPADAAAEPAPGEASLRRLTAIVYGLQLAGYFTGISPLVGVVINYVKRDAVAGTWLESHFRWQIRTFWITLAWGLAGMALLLVFVGLFVLAIGAMWFLYRAIKGWIELSEGKPMYGP